MAVFRIVTLAELGEEVVLAPERHRPGRELVARGPSVPLGELVTLSSELVTPRAAAGARVVDTGDAAVGFLRLAAAGRPASAKKRLRQGDVVISRLRPYLRQVAWVDAALDGAVSSTEFYVLRPTGRASIAFLVPFLLARGPQAALAASVEGAHHPRFSREALLALPVPRRLVARRRALSLAIERAVAARRRAETAVERAVSEAERALTPAKARRPRARGARPAAR